MWLFLCFITYILYLWFVQIIVNDRNQVLVINPIEAHLNMINIRFTHIATNNVVKFATQISNAEINALLLLKGLHNVIIDNTKGLFLDAFVVRVDDKKPIETPIFDKSDKINIYE